jgi:hypothetical protein
MSELVDVKEHVRDVREVRQGLFGVYCQFRDTSLSCWDHSRAMFLWVEWPPANFLHHHQNWKRISKSQ